jgi:hypothetical protein
MPTPMYPPRYSVASKEKQAVVIVVRGNYDMED